MNRVKVTNMTSLFSKEMMMYSFFDIRLKSPLRVTAILYFFLLFLIIGVPTLYLAWPPNVYSVAFAFGVPIAGATLMSRPIWNGKSFWSFVKTHIKYFRRPRVLYDWRSASPNTIYRVDSTITVSRHKDYNLLYNIVKKEEEALING